MYIFVSITVNKYYDINENCSNLRLAILITGLWGILQFLDVAAKVNSALLINGLPKSLKLAKLFLPNPLGLFNRPKSGDLNPKSNLLVISKSDIGGGVGMGRSDRNKVGTRSSIVLPGDSSSDVSMLNSMVNSEAIALIT